MQRCHFFHDHIRLAATPSSSIWTPALKRLSDSMPMAVSRLAILTIFLAFIVSCVTADVIVGEAEDLIGVVRKDGSDSSTLKFELEKLNSKIQELESLISEKTRELEKKDDIISQKDKIFKDKSDRVSFLQSEIESLQREGKLHAEEVVAKAHARAVELEKRVKELKRELDARSREKVALETRSKEAKEKTHQFISKLEKLQNVNEEQWGKIRKIERALKVAEEEMIKAKFEATSKTKELMEVHGAWLPPWLASLWNEDVKPAVNLVMQKVLVGKAQLENWVGPGVESIKANWIPAMHEQWLVVKTNFKPHLQLVSQKTLEVYKAANHALTPHIIRAQEFVNPYFQKVKMVSKPYVDHVATVTKPHVDKVQVALSPYTTELVHTYRNLLQSATTHHQKVKAIIQEVLNKYDFTRPFAPKGFEWFLVSAFLALPVIILFSLCSCFFRKKAKKPVRSANSSQVRHKAKRGSSSK